MANPRWLACAALLVLLRVGCAQSTGPCPPQPCADLSAADAYPKDDRLPFQFPLDDLTCDASPPSAHFCTSSSGPESARKYHAAEDFLRPAGTPVYAMADGKVSFSGPMGGYGWLVIVDHPQANLYSLYGHLSPSRWHIGPGPVAKGELVGYLGDSDENGGNAEHPLVPHLHFGVRAGQRRDYPGMGEWRWQAGWIKPCPQDLGWLQPSAIIAAQDIPVGGFSAPSAGLVEIWGLTLLFAGIYLVGGVSVLVTAIRTKRPLILAIGCGAMTAAAWFLRNKGYRVSEWIFTMAVLIAAVGICHFIRHSTQKPPALS